MYYRGTCNPWAKTSKTVKQTNGNNAAHFSHFTQQQAVSQNLSVTVNHLAWSCRACKISQGLK